MDDLERFGMWAQDRASALFDAPSMVVDEGDSDPAHPAKPALRSTLSAKVEKFGLGLLSPKPLADDPLALAPPIVQADALHWNIPFWIDPSGLPPQMPKDRAIALVVKAAASWRACGAHFSYQGERAKPAYGSYGPGEAPLAYLPVVGWMGLPDKVTGLTLTESDTSTGQVERWTMDLDTDSSVSASDILATATHEFGHVLGINHARDIRSIMFGGPNPKILRPSAPDISECQRVISTWSTESASDMASPLADALAETPSAAVQAATAASSIPIPISMDTPRLPPKSSSFAR